MWLLPLSLLVATTLVAVPMSRYMAWILNGKFRAPRILHWFEARVDSGPQNWKQYTVSLLVFNIVLFVFGFAVLSVQPFMPLNTLNRGMLEPTTIFHSAVSFMTNTNLQHYSGDQAFSNFSQLFFCISNFFLSASVGLCALTLIVRLFRGDSTCGNYFVDMWRVLIYIFLPVAFVLSLIWVQQGAPMTLACARDVATVETGSMGTADDGSAKPQTVVLGPLAAFVPMKMLGTNGGGFYGMNSAHPFENPTALTNWFTTFAMMLFPFSLVLMYGRMLGRLRHSWVIFSVMMLLMIGTIIWTVCFDTLQPNPGLTARSVGEKYTINDPTAPGGKRDLEIPTAVGLPVDQHLGNLEGKEMRFGTSAGATFAALTVDVTCGAVNCEHDSLNPVSAALADGRHVAQLHFRRQGGGDDQLPALFDRRDLHRRHDGRADARISRQENRSPRGGALALVAMLVHPIMILGPTGLFAATSWGNKATSNPGPHGFSQIMYQFSSASANNGSAFDGLGVSYGLNNNANPSPEAVPFDIATGLVMLLSRYLPIIAPIVMAASLGAKKSAPFGLGTLRDDTPTFGFLMLGTIGIVGALLFLPVAALGPLAEHLGPFPFGG